jgi:uncharacterized protein with PQ loop repeat
MIAPGIDSSYDNISNPVVKYPRKSLYNKMKMLKYMKLFLIFLLISFFFQSCYSTYSIPVNTKTESSVSKSIQVITKDGRIYELVDYTITDNAIIGKDSHGNRVEILKENIEIIKGKKPNKIVVAAFIIGFAAFLLSGYLLAQVTQAGR